MTETCSIPERDARALAVEPGPDQQPATAPQADEKTADERKFFSRRREFRSSVAYAPTRLMAYYL